MASKRRIGKRKGQAEERQERRAMELPEVDRDPVASLLRVYRKACDERAEKAQVKKDIVRASQGKRGLKESLNQRSSVEIDPRLRTAELSVAICQLLRHMHARPTLDDLKEFVGEIPRRLDLKDRADLMQLFSFIFAEGEMLSFLAVECLQWLCLDTRLRRCLLLKTDCISALTGSALIALSQESEAQSLPVSNQDQILGASSADHSFVQSTVHLFVFLLQVDKEHTRARLLESRAIKVLCRIRQQEKNAPDASLASQVNFLIDQLGTTQEGKRQIDRVEKMISQKCV